MTTPAPPSSPRRPTRTTTPRLRPDYKVLAAWLVVATASLAGCSLPSMHQAGLPAPPAAATSPATPAPGTASSSPSTPAPSTSSGHDAPTPQPSTTADAGTNLAFASCAENLPAMLAVTLPDGSADLRAFATGPGVHSACQDGQDAQVMRSAFNAAATTVAATSCPGGPCGIGVVDSLGRFTALSAPVAAGFGDVHDDEQPLFDPRDDRLWFVRDHDALWSIDPTHPDVPARLELSGQRLDSFGIHLAQDMQWQFTPFGDVTARLKINALVGMPGVRRWMQMYDGQWQSFATADDAAPCSLPSAAEPVMWLDDHRLLASDGSQLYLDTFSNDRLTDHTIALLPATTGRHNYSFVLARDGDSYAFVSSASAAASDDLSGQQVFTSRVSTPGAPPRQISTTSGQLLGWITTTPATTSA